MPKAKLTLNERIARALMLGLQQKIPGIPTIPERCLQFVRVGVEYAIGLEPRGFYRLIQGVDSNPSARELEALIRKNKPSWVVSSPKAGDLVWWTSCFEGDKYGHVGGLVKGLNGKLWVAQNTTIAHGGIDYPGNLRLVPLAEMQTPTMYSRIGG